MKGARLEERIEVRSRDELRAWLAENHARRGSVWLVTYKKHMPGHLPVEEVVPELLAWGWVDSLPRSVDAERTSLRISPRNPRSAWSAVNKRHVERLRATGRMTPAGEAAIEAARANGMWDFLDDVERLDVPGDLAAALDAAGAGEAWQAYPRSVRRGTLEWIKSARRAETRARRIAGTAEAAAAGDRPPPFSRG